MNQPRNQRNLLVVILMLSLILGVSVIGLESKENVQLQDYRQTLISKLSSARYGVRGHRNQLKMADTQVKRKYHEEKILKLDDEIKNIHTEIRNTDFKLTAYTLKVLVSIIGVMFSGGVLFLSYSGQEDTKRLDIKNNITK